MEKLTQQFAKIPWSSFGRKTRISKLARSIVPIGNHPARLPPDKDGMTIELGAPGYEKQLLDIQGTAFQVGRGKLLTCWHVCQALEVSHGRAYFQSTYQREDGVVLKSYWPVVAQHSFIDPRSRNGNPDIDVGMVICPALGTPERPYDVPIVQWGDSTSLGIGDEVLVGGFPLGTKMFLALNTNRGVVQPSFFDGIISAIIPATKPTETRLLQISSVALGGMSGGVVCERKTGAVVGMVTSGLSHGETAQDLPITYAVPSEVLRPYADAISFKAQDGNVWR